MNKALSVRNILNKKRDKWVFDGKWHDAIGDPEPTGCWLIYGNPKNGKTSFAFILTKYLTKFGRVLYNSFEEKDGLTIGNSIQRYDMLEVNGHWIMPQGGYETITTMIERLKKTKSPNIIVIDSVQLSGITLDEYKYLTENFPKKLFIFISHVQGRYPDGSVALRIWRTANVAVRIEGFKAFFVSRYGGGEPIVISEEKADKYWGLI
jgi:hypothetical protein